MSYTPLYKPTFDKNLKIYASLKKQIEKKVIFILDDPYYNTEPLQDKKGYDLRGLRSKKIDRNFRIIFAICEECKQMRLQDKNINICIDCPEDAPEKTVIFLTVGTHKGAYTLR